MTTEPESSSPSPPTPVAPPQPLQKGYVSGVTDGNLATPVPLRHFLYGLGVVMRLPKKLKKRIEPPKPVGETRAEELKIGVPTWGKITTVVVGGIVATCLFLVYRQFFHSDPVPEKVVGTWSTKDGRYEGRSFWLNPKAVAFQTGKSSTEFTAHPIKRVAIRTKADTLYLNIDYESDGGKATLSIAYLGNPTPAIRLVNQPGVRWRRSGNAPVIIQ